MGGSASDPSAGFRAVNDIADRNRALVIQRNHLAAALLPGQSVGSTMGTAPALPPMIQNAQQCGRCFARHNCLLYHKAVENGTVESSGVEPALWLEATQHVTAVQLEYFRTWDRLIDLEHEDAQRSRSDIWALPSVLSEPFDRCLGVHAYPRSDIPQMILTMCLQLVIWMPVLVPVAS